MANGNGNGNGASGRWQWFMSATTAVAIVAGALLTFFVQAASLNTTVSIDAARIIALELDQHTQNTQAALMLAELAGLRSEIREARSQLCGSDHLHNLMHAYDLRMQALLWRQAFPNSSLPTDNAYYPDNCK